MPHSSPHRCGVEATEAAVADFMHERKALPCADTHIAGSGGLGSSPWSSWSLPAQPRTKVRACSVACAHRRLRPRARHVHRFAQSRTTMGRHGSLLWWGFSQQPLNTLCITGKTSASHTFAPILAVPRRSGPRRAYERVETEPGLHTFAEDAPGAGINPKHPTSHARAALRAAFCMRCSYLFASCGGNSDTARCLRWSSAKHCPSTLLNTPYPSTRAPCQQS